MFDPKKAPRLGRFLRAWLMSDTSFRTFVHPSLNGHVKVVLDFNFYARNSCIFERNLSNSVQFRLFLTPSRCRKPAFHRWTFETFVQFFSFCPILLTPWRRKAEARFVLCKMHFCLDFAKPPGPPVNTAMREEILNWTFLTKSFKKNRSIIVGMKKKGEGGKFVQLSKLTWEFV